MYHELYMYMPLEMKSTTSHIWIKIHSFLLNQHF